MFLCVAKRTTWHWSCHIFCQRQLYKYRTYNSFIAPCHARRFRTFSVTQNPKYFPSIMRVWASIAGKEPKKTVESGRKNHCSATPTYLKRDRSLGSGGRSKKVRAPFTTSPNEAIIIRLRVQRGKLNASTV